MEHYRRLFWVLEEQLVEDIYEDCEKDKGDGAGSEYH